MNDMEKKMAAEARRAYARAWRAKNPDKVRKNNENYWLRKAQKDALIIEKYAKDDTKEADNHEN